MDTRDAVTEYAARETGVSLTSRLETLFWLQLQQAGLDDGWERQYRFCPPRRWTFDFALPYRALAVEIEGGSFVYGRHNRPSGFAADLEKYNTATLLGWRLLRFTGAMLNEDDAIPWVRKLVESYTPR